MKDLITGQRQEKGSVMVIALMLLVVLTLIGIIATRTSTTDIKIAGNHVPYRQNFFIAQGGLNREAEELGRGNYSVTDIGSFDSLICDQNSGDLPLPTPHEVAGTAYDFKVIYKGHFHPPKGYSIINFRRYDYYIEATAGQIKVASRYYKIGPKAED